jgi:hypothetical protein
MACRAKAVQDDKIAKQIENPGLREPLENTARRAAILAEKFEWARKLTKK